MTASTTLEGQRDDGVARGGLTTAVASAAANLQESTNASATLGCGLAFRAGRPRSVLPADELLVPKHKRILRDYVKSGTTAVELRLYHGVKEISFDDPQLFAFAERLGVSPRFVAEDATRWSGGAPYAWAVVQPLLDSLIEEGIVQFACDATDEAPTALPVPSPLSAAPATTPRAWSASTEETESLFRDLVGHAIEPGYLEALVPVYRIAHPALDGEGRQVGEANVFPRALRLDVTTEWRICNYPGSRYRDEMPMNVTSLKAMIKHWRPMMAALSAARDEYARRYPRVRQGWTVIDAHALSCIVLSIPAHTIMSAQGGVGAVDPVIASLFRISDGIRIATHDMLFLNEDPLPPAAPLTTQMLYDYVERNNNFLSDQGVCSGPKHLIEAFLEVFFDGTAREAASSNEAVDPAFATSLSAAMDYGLCGLQMYAIVFHLWVEMSRAYEGLLEILDSVAAKGQSFASLRARLRADMLEIEEGLLSTEEFRSVSTNVYAAMFDHAARGLTACAASSAPSFADCVKSNGATSLDIGVLRAMLHDTVGGVTTESLDETMNAIAVLIRSYLTTEQATLRAATGLARSINTILGRKHPTRPLAGRDLAAHWKLRKGDRGILPYLLTALDEAVGLCVTTTADTVALKRRSLEIFTDG